MFCMMRISLYFLRYPFTIQHSGICILIDTIFFISPKIVTLERMDMGGHSIKNPINEDESKENKDTIMQSPLPSTPRISKSDLITWMLSGHDKDAHNRHSALSTLINSPSATQLEF